MDNFMFDVTADGEQTLKDFLSWLAEPRGQVRRVLSG
jgi:hypothetical protein